MSFREISKLASAAALLIFAGSSYAAYDCTNVPAYAQGTYNFGAIVKNVGSAFQCKVGGWCSVGGPYEPGVGWANEHAWTNLGTCEGDVLPSSSSARSVASSVRSIASSSNSSVPGSSSVSSDAGCGAARTWDSNTVYVRGDTVSHQGAIYRARWWTQNQTPSRTSDVWEYIGTCGSSSSVVSSSRSSVSSGGTSSIIRSSTSSVSSSIGNSGLRIVGYVPSWSGNANSIQYSKLTHINYAFVLPRGDGNLNDVPSPALLHAVVANAHANGVKVALSVGGWNDGNDSAFVELAADATKQARFRVELLKKVDEFNLDGIDIDWEYPDPNTPESANYTTLMRLLSYDLRVKGKYLTAAVVGDGETGNGVQPEVFQHVEFLNLMAYDLNNSDHSPYSYAVTSLNYWTSRGLPTAKAVLGVPYYARPSWSGYNVKVGQNANNACRDTDGSDYWNGVPTIRNKAQLARNYGGIMTWELSQDTNSANSLLTAMWEVMTFNTGSFVCR